MKNKKQIYIHETHNISQSNGELYIEGKFGSLVWNCETLFTDLPYIIKYVYEARAETDKRVKEDIEKTITLEIK